MDKYTVLMQEIFQYLNDAWLWSYRGGSIHGSSEVEIDTVEQSLGRKLPLAMRAWYLRAGAVPPYLNDYDADYSLDDLKRAQQTAADLVPNENSQWELDQNIIPFSQRIGEQFLFVNIAEGNANDPPVYHYLEYDPLPRLADQAFSVHIRELWLGWLDFPLLEQENYRETRAWNTKSRDDWMKRKRLLDTLQGEALEFRKHLLETVYREDLAKSVITGPRAFQERWLQEFVLTETWIKLQDEGLRTPFGWVDPPG